MLWECDKGHQWEAIYTNVYQGSWCPECNKNTIQDCQAAAYIKNGKCLSLEYKNNNTKMLWECSLGHRWEAVYSKIQQGQWCPDCAGHKRKTIQDCHNLASIKNGKCLSVDYINGGNKLTWECSEGHQWDAIYNAVKRGQWCPECGYLKAAKNSNNGGIIFHWKTSEELIWKASWEEKVIRYLNYNNINFWWQPANFKMPLKTKTGKLSTYRPDLYLPDNDIWIEIKGRWYDEESKNKWLWFHQAYPNSELWDKNKLKQLGIL